MSSTTTPTTFRPSWRRRAALLGLIAPLTVVAACGSGGSDAKSTTTAAPTTTEATTTTTEVDGDAAGEEFQGLVEDADAAISKEAADRDALAADNDLDGAIESVAGLQEDLEDFQSELGDLEVPEDAQDAVDELDDATGEYIDALAGYQDVDDIPGYNDQLDIEADAAKAWRGAVADAADALGVDGIEGSDTSDDDDGGGVSEGGGEEASSGPIEGDGSEYCLVSDDLPDGFLPLAGKDNMSNALGYTFDEGPEAAYANDLVASWMALPDGGAGPDDLTADCMIHIFDSTESAEGFYEAYTSDYGASSMPEPEEVDVPDGAPGEDPHAYANEIGGRPDGTQIFRYENVVVSVGLSGTSNNDIETVLAATNDLANIVYDRLESAG